MLIVVLHSRRWIHVWHHTDYISAVGIAVSASLALAVFRMQRRNSEFERHQAERDRAKQLRDDREAWLDSVVASLQAYWRQLIDYQKTSIRIGRMTPNDNDTIIVIQNEVLMISHLLHVQINRTYNLFDKYKLPSIDRLFSDMTSIGKGEIFNTTMNPAQVKIEIKKYMENIADGWKELWLLVYQANISNAKSSSPTR